MPWQEVATVTLREQFIAAALTGDQPMSVVCRQFQISRKTGYKWLARYRAEGVSGLQDRSRRPHQSPERTAATVEQQVLLVRDRHPAWGARKIAAVLARQGVDVPAVSTITAILDRHGRLDPQERAKHRAYQRFMAPHPNALWQLDFKGWRALSSGQGSCHPLSVLDDHSRWLVGLVACDNQQESTVRRALIRLFEETGMPERLLADNGPPWGTGHPNSLTELEVWLLRLGITVTHGRPRHPQTQGKVERLHRTLGLEVGDWWNTADLAGCQGRFDTWRTLYNQERPHEALGMAVPASRYVPSARPYPQRLPPIDYGPGTTVRTIQANGWLHFQGQRYRISRALRGQPVALRPTSTDGVLSVVYCQHQVAQLDLRADTPEVLIRVRKVEEGVTHVPEHL